MAKVPFEPIVDEAYSGLDRGLREAIRDERRWTELWAEVHRRVSPRPPVPPVDFSRHMLVVVAMGTRRSGGFDITVREVALREGRLEVQVLETCPAPGSMTSMALTQPVQVVRLERLSQEVVFRAARGPSCP